MLNVDPFFTLHVIIEFIRDPHYRSLLMTSSFVLLAGSTFYHYQEDWSWVDSLYFSFITLTTIGFGDVTPVTDAGKVFTIFYVTVGLGLVLSFIQAIFEHYTIRVTERRKSISQDQ